MKLEVGKYYRTREGLKVGPAAQNETGAWTAVAPDGVTVWGYCANGNFGQRTGLLRFSARRNAEIERDIMDEWAYETPPCVTQELADEPILDAASGQQKAEPAWKQDGGKPRLDLIAPEFLFGTAEVLTYGVEKYSKKVENEWHALLLAEHVESLRLLTPEGCVVVVTKSTCGRPILSLQSASDKIDENGKPETLTECGNWPSVEKMILRLAPGTKRQNGALRSASMDWTNRDTKPCAPQGAPYAGPNVTCTLTIATKRGDFEVSFAPDAITGLDFWATVWGDLNARFGILKPQSQTGARNWERGMSWGRVFGALMRHMWAWWGGAGPSRANFIFGEVDEETGFSHLWHAACCLMFLIAYEQRKIGTDDRKNPVDNS